MQPTICKGSCNCMCPVMLMTWSPPTWTPGVQQLQDFITAVCFWHECSSTHSEKLVSSVLKCQGETASDKHLTWQMKTTCSPLCVTWSNHLLPPPVARPPQPSRAAAALGLLSWAKSQNGTWYLITSCKLPQRDAAVCRKWNLDVSLYQGQGKGK